MDYIERIKKIKTDKKITNERLSELTGIPLGTLSKILAGMNDSPKLSNVISISEALGCSVDYLISGKPDNEHNFTLSSDEISFIEKFRQLDSCGRDIALFVVSREYGRLYQQNTEISPKIIVNEINSSAPVEIKNAPIRRSSEKILKRSVFLYDLPVSAGTGVYLDESTAEKINIPDNDKTSSADFALRISGNSMEPKYHDGDILLVENCNSVQIGELGIFILDGNGYFKKYGGERLISLNPNFEDILLKNYSDISCCGRVVGRLKKK